MATKYATIKGHLKWAKVYEPDEYAGASNWKLDLYFADDNELKKFEALGLQITVKEDVDGKFARLRRPVKKLIGDDLVFFTPPEITGAVKIHYVNSDGTQIRQYKKGENYTRVGEPVIIGNGSMALVNFSYYDTSKGKGTRLENIKIIDLVEYVKDDDTPPVEDTSGGVKVEKAAPSVKNDLDDDIPW